MRWSTTQSTLFSALLQLPPGPLASSSSISYPSNCSFPMSTSFAFCLMVTRKRSTSPADVPSSMVKVTFTCSISSAGAVREIEPMTTYPVKHARLRHRFIPTQILGFGRMLPCVSPGIDSPLRCSCSLLSSSREKDLILDPGEFTWLPSSVISHPW